MSARTAIWIATVAIVASCGGGPSAPPFAPTELPSPSSIGVPSPPSPATTFAVDLPVDFGDTAANAYGIWPFGVHGSSHAADGHPGFDVEFRLGSSVRAAADGTIQHVMADSQTAGRYTVRIDHSVGARHYATDYTNVSSLAAGIAAGAAVTRGQPLGAAGIQSQFIGTSQVTWAMTHFQVNDFARSEGLTNPNAVSPESFLSATGRSVFESLWRTAVYQTEWCEPFATNSRLAGFPMSRTWTLRSGSLAARLDVRCISENSADYEYTFRAADGSQVDTGTLTVNATVKPLARVDARASNGSNRLGVYDIVGDTLRLNFGAAGGSRPSSLDGAAVYETR